MRVDSGQRRLPHGVRELQRVLRVRPGVHRGREENPCGTVVQRAGRHGRVEPVELPSGPHLLVHAPDHGAPPSVRFRFVSFRFVSLILFFSGVHFVCCTAVHRRDNPCHDWVAQPVRVWVCLYIRLLGTTM